MNPNAYDYNGNNRYNPYAQGITRSRTISVLDSRERYLHTMFQTIDRDRSGSISVDELERTLVNGDMSHFNRETVRMLVNMFDSDHNGTINFQEFHGLWKYVEDWSQRFRYFDRDNSGSIDEMEMQYALRSFGFNLSQSFVHMLMGKFVTQEGRSDISFDNFVQACVTVYTLTESFKRKDYEGRGEILINYEGFLDLVIRCRPDVRGS
ncbi:hypothetical protein BDB01DRAFT_814833 [Pilobolus umbonatus]|nr:hypothetical protein BDB01DRAFT_814833 [Pilobolus umbonatus]